MNQKLQLLASRKKEREKEGKKEGEKEGKREREKKEKKERKKGGREEGKHQIKKKKHNKQTNKQKTPIFHIPSFSVLLARLQSSRVNFPNRDLPYYVGQMSCPLALSIL